jgi:hypothetical protein
LQLDDRDVHDRMVGTVSFSASEAADLDKVIVVPLQFFLLLTVLNNVVTVTKFSHLS